MISNETDVERYERRASEFVSDANRVSAWYSTNSPLTNMYEELAADALSVANRLRLEALN